MNTIVDYFIYPLSPILALTVAAVLLLCLECLPGGGKNLRRIKLWVSLAGTVASGLCIWHLGRNWPIAFSTVGYTGNAVWLQQFVHNFRLDMTSLTFFLGVDVFTFLGIVFMNSHFRDSEIRSEVFVLTLFIASGMMLLVSADTLLMIFLALELLSLPTYVLVGIHRKDKQSCEAALKYFLYGSFATVLLVFGIAVLYAQFGVIEIPALATLIGSASRGNLIGQVPVMASLALMLIAVGFKIGMVPFHMWVPDAYQGAPTPVTGYMGSAVKLAGFGLVLRLMWGLFLPIAGHWTVMINTLAVITMFVGNLAALQQEDLKRMWAYSSVSHAGYLLLAVGSISKAGPNPTLVYYYLIVYGLMFLGFFAILNLIEQHTHSTEISQISGLGFTHPVLGGCLALFAFSGAGIPPTAGFLAKYFVFLEAVRAENTPFVILGVISSLIGVYYYLRVVVYLYMKEPKERLALPHSSRFAFACIIACALSVLYFTVAPATLGLNLIAR